MDRRRAIALAFALCLIGTLFATVPAASRAAPAAPPHPAATDYVYAAAGGGCGGFSPGLACGHIYFAAFDPSDNVAVVSIKDQNYSRDGISAVAQSWNVSFQTSAYNDSRTWGASYFLPMGLQLGGWWNISITGTVGGTFNSSFFVDTYTVSMLSTQGAYLARHSGTGLYYVNQTVNNAPRMGVTSLTLTGEYYTNVGSWVSYPGSPINLGNASWGNFSFVIPSDASTYGWLDFTLFANISGGSYPNVEMGFLDVPLGTVSAPQVELATCLSSSCVGNTFTNGTPVYVLTQTWIYSPGGDFPAPGLNAAFEFDAGVTPVTPAGGWPSTVTTNATGGASILFLASSSDFPSGQTDSVKVSVTDPLNTGQTYGPTTVDFNVVTSAAGSAALQVMLNSAQYFGGDTATASWQLGGFPASLAQGWQVDAYWVVEVASSTIVATGVLASTSATGSFSFTVPMGYGGDILVGISAHNATSSLSTTTEATVTAPTILLNPSEASYLPGDTVTVSITTLGQVFASATLFANVVDDLGNVYISGPISGNQLSIPIPAVATPSSVSIHVGAQDPTAGLLGGASLTLDEAGGLWVQAGISTPSNYADGSFQPGQTVQLHFQFSAYGNAVLAKSYAVYVYPYSGFYTRGGNALLETTSTSGDVSYTIPAGTPAGAQLFEVYVVGAACLSACYGVNLFSVDVQPNPSALQYNLGAGSGLTVGWLVLLLLIVIVAVLLVMMIRNRDRPKMMKPITPATSGGSSAPSEGGSGSPPPGAWQEGSGSSGGSSPPLPGNK